MRTNALLAVAALYGPFLAMTGYTLAVDQAANGRMACQCLPVGPAIVPFMMLKHWVRVPMPDERGGYVLGIAISLALVAALAWLLGKVGGYGKAMLTLLATTAFAFCAYGVLMLIRA